MFLPPRDDRFLFRFVVVETIGCEQENKVASIKLLARFHVQLFVLGFLI